MLPDACYFVDEPPEFRCAGDLFHVTVRVGGRRIERVMRPHVMFRAFQLAAQAIQDYHASETDDTSGVVQFPRAS